MLFSPLTPSLAPLIVCAGGWLWFHFVCRQSVETIFAPSQSKSACKAHIMFSAPCGDGREWFTQLAVLCGRGQFPLFQHACSAHVDHAVLLPLISVIIWPEIMLEPLKSNSFWSLPPSIPPSLHPSGFRFPLFFFFFFPLPTAKLVNIKYLLFYFGFCFFFFVIIVIILLFL